MSWLRTGPAPRYVYDALEFCPVGPARRSQTNDRDHAHTASRYVKRVMADSTIEAVLIYSAQHSPPAIKIRLALLLHGGPFTHGAESHRLPR
jgi:hypothetical protein